MLVTGPLLKNIENEVTEQKTTVSIKGRVQA
jgi:hypothetical protein